MKKAFLAATALIFLGLIFVWVGYPFSGKPTVTSSSKASPGLPVAGSVSVRTSGTSPAPGMSVAAQNGTMTTINFLSEASTTKDPINSGYYYLGPHPYEGVGSATTTASPPYMITYIASTQYFIIALLREPIGSVRLQMQSYLLDYLGITASEACNLNYMVSVPYWVNQTFSGRNLGFSFCPGAVVLPS